MAHMLNGTLIQKTLLSRLYKKVLIVTVIYIYIYIYIKAKTLCTYHYRDPIIISDIYI
jgi:hypothetical protein